MYVHVCMYVGGNTFNLFDLLLEVQEELALTNKLAALRFSPEANQFISQAAIAVGTAKAVDPHLAQVSTCMYVCTVCMYVLYVFMYILYVVCKLYVCTYFL